MLGTFANGDQIPLLSKETSSGTWNNEGEATAMVQPSLRAGGEPRTVVTFRARHLTLWNLDWPMPSCSFSRFIDVVDSSFNPVPDATAMNFSYRITIADATGVFGGHIRTTNANASAGGFNVLQFQNAPNVNVVRIIAYNAPNAMGAIIAFRNFNAAADNKLCEGAGRLFLPLD